MRTCRTQMQLPAIFNLSKKKKKIFCTLGKALKLLQTPCSLHTQGLFCGGEYENSFLLQASTAEMFLNYARSLKQSRM